MPKRPAGTAPLASIRLLWPFVALAHEHGYANAAEHVRRALGLSRAELDDPLTRVPVTKLSKLLDQAIAASGQRDLGLLAARLVDASHFGIGEYVARSRPTLRDALIAGLRYIPLLGDAAHHRLELAGKLARVSVWLDPEVHLHEAAYEFLLAMFVLRSRRTTGQRDLAPLEVHFTHAQPADISRHERVFRCRLRFSMPITQVVMSRKVLEQPMASAEPNLSSLLEQQAEALLDQVVREKDLPARVRELIAAEPDLRRASAERVAARLGMSSRTLARKLADAGSGYRELVDDVRKQLALRELARSERSIAELASALGFASSQGFHRAFRRWTRTSAAQYRKRTRKKTRS